MAPFTEKGLLAVHHILITKINKRGLEGDKVSLLYLFAKVHYIKEEQLRCNERRCTNCRHVILLFCCLLSIEGNFSFDIQLSLEFTVGLSETPGTYGTRVVTAGV